MTETNRRRRLGRARPARALAAALLALAVAIGSACPALAYEQREAVVSAGHGRISPDYLVVHETANPGASAANHVAYWRNNQPNVEMAHYVMELDGSVVYHTQADDAKAWHVGGGNSRAVGIELAHATSREDFLAQWSEAAQWCADYLNARGWGVERMLAHQECGGIWGGTDHTDPLGYFHKYGKTWAEFEAEVAARMSGQAAPPAPQRPAQGGLGDTSWTGPRMVREMQRQLGTPADGIVSGQTGYNSGAVQWAVTVSPPAAPARGSSMVAALQRFLAAHGQGVGPSGADGHMGHDTVRALQRYLIASGIDVGPSGADGWYGNATSRAVGEALQRGLFR